MKLEKNMYVRKKNGRIGRIREIDERDNVQLWYLLDIKNSNFDVKCEEKHIKKASHDIIDLIEVGDYVNGHQIIALRKDISARDIHPSSSDCNIFTDYTLAEGWYFGIKDEYIKSIVTKEQFEKMQYKVGE